MITDGDVCNKKRAKVYAEMLKDGFYVLPGKEIENLIPEEVLRKAVEKNFTERERSVDGIVYSKYKKPGAPLGKYLDSLLDPPGERPCFAGPSGTIKGGKKATLCEKATEAMADKKFEWRLTSELKELCIRIFDHILKENQE